MIFPHFGTDPYLRERLHDFDDLANRLLRQLTGFVPGGAGLPQDAIIVARAMGAANCGYPRVGNTVASFLEDGAIYQPCGLVARGDGLLRLSARSSALHSLAKNGIRSSSPAGRDRPPLRPISEVQSAYADKVRFRAKRQEQFRALRKVKCGTRDVAGISLQLCNAGFAGGLCRNSRNPAPAASVLFRTELQLMTLRPLPKVGEQGALLPQCCLRAGGLAGG